jgi:hypothetical protein
MILQRGGVPGRKVPRAIYLAHAAGAHQVLELEATTDQLPDLHS